MKMTLALMMGMLSTHWLAAQPRLDETLRKAVVEQDSEHNLAAAVADYQSIVAQFDEQRKTAATALFRLGECYRQQGKKDQAIVAYRRVIQEFADQTKLAEQSRAVLQTTYQIHPETSVQQNPEEGTVLREEARQQEARERYRRALLEQIKIADANLSRMQRLVDLGTLGEESLMDARNQILNLQRQLAAFDLGVIPK